MSMGSMPGLPGISTIQAYPGLTSRVQGWLVDQGLSWFNVAPPLPVDSERNFFYVYPFDYGRRALNTKREIGGQSPQSAPSIQTGTFTISEDVHKTPMLKRLADLSSSSPQAFKGYMKMSSDNPALVVGLALEVRTATFVQTDSNYYDSSTQVAALTSGDHWDESTSNPKEDIVQLARVLGLTGGGVAAGVQLEGLTLAIPYHIMLTLRVNSDVRNQKVYTMATDVKNIDQAALQAYFGVGELVILGAQRITTNIDATTDTNSYLWGNSVYLFKKDAGANQDTPTSGAWFTPSRSGKVLPVARTFPSYDPEGTYFECQALSCTAAGAPSGYGTRTAARLDNVLATP